MLIIGGGATGTAIARDLALRGIQCILAEKDDLNSGASGGNHGLLHSGGRYVSNDQEAAVECRQEGDIIRRLAPQLIEDTGGFFSAVQGDDEKYIADFPVFCSQCGISCKKIDIKSARELEPELSPKTIAVYAVPDGSIDPFKLTILNMRHAMQLGSILLRRTRVTGFEIENKRIVKTRLLCADTGKEITIEAEQIVNASGAWAGEVASLAGISLDIIYSKGTLLITNDRINRRVINRLRPPSDSDILVPGGTVSILGTTSIKIKSLNDIYPTVEEINRIVGEGSKMVPALETVRYIRAFSGVRPLFGKPASSKDDSGGRNVSRGFALLDHIQNNLENFATITGGKLTTYRLMAERTADLISSRLGLKQQCLTRTETLAVDPCGEWTEPALSPKTWMRSHQQDDMLLCECEMVSKSAINNIIQSIRNNNERPDLLGIALRSRLGKGACQGAFCGARVSSYMHDCDLLDGKQGLQDLKAFYQERWKGIYSILWGDQLVQAELTEALHCGIFDLDLLMTIQKEMV